MASTNTHRPHVAFLPFPFSSHCSLLFSVARLIAAAVPNAAISFFGTVKSNAQLAGIPAPGNLRLYTVADGCPEGYVPTSTVPVKEVELFIKATPGNYMEAMQVAVGEGAGGVRVSCVVSDCFLSFVGKMAEEMGVPWVAMWAGGAGSLSAHVHTDDISRITGVGDQVIPKHGDKSLDFIQGLSALRVRDLPEGIVFGNLDSPFSRLIHLMAQDVPRATAVVVNTFEEMEPGMIADLKTKLNSCLSMSPVNLLPPSQTRRHDDPFNCLSWLEHRAPASVVYVAFGTMASLQPAELVALAEALESSGFPFLWSLKSKFLNHLPTGFLDRTSSTRGLVVPWTPQVEVLGHEATGVFVTHYGWNSVLESIVAGVPMIGRPAMFDQRLNAREASHLWEIGLVLDGGALTKDWVADAIDRVMRTEQGKRMREKVGTMEEQVGLGASATENFNSLVEIVCGTIPSTI